MECMTVLGYGVCTPDADLREALPFEAGDIDRNAIPAMLRRRTSQATQMAFSAATRACACAGRTPGEVPAIFACVGGEIQITDQLCIELAKPDGVISPTAFHNSVHNTAAGYWSIVHRSTCAATAMAAGHATFAMALMEAWCQLACHGGEVLLVCYDERWPGYLSPPMGEPVLACAVMLAAGPVPNRTVSLGCPERPDTALSFPREYREWVERMPVLAAIPLLTALAQAKGVHDVPLVANGNWLVRARAANLTSDPSK